MEPGEWYTPYQLRQLPSLGTGQADEQVGDTGDERVWWGRTEDSPAVSVERLIDGRWVTDYEGYPFRVRIDRSNKVEIDEGI